MKEVVSVDIPLPKQIKVVIDKVKVATQINNYLEFKAFLTEI